MSARQADAGRQAGGGDFLARQWTYFRDVDAEKFRWHTAGPFFAETEQRLISVAAGGGRFLEVGCGEGGNLFHLGPRGDLTVGVDYSLPKLEFAASMGPWARFLCADAVRLPFRDGAFDRVLCRDVLHHLEPGLRRDAVGELYRVCRPGSEVVVIEPNGRNPVMAALAVLVPAERGLLRSNPARLHREIRAVASGVRLHMAQPLPIARALLHYRFGMPTLGRQKIVKRALMALDGILDRVLPRFLWAYIIVRGQVPARPPWHGPAAIDPQSDPGPLRAAETAEREIFRPSPGPDRGEIPRGNRRARRSSQSGRGQRVGDPPVGDPGRLAQQEIEHSRRLAASHTELTWGWETPAGRMRARRRAALIASGAGLGPGMRVLEVGCGTGLFTELFAQTGVAILATDISEELLVKARARGLPEDRVQFLRGRFEDQGIGGPFDAVIGSSVLHHL
ncbi:MAG TPA: methyltransferase domain-containing protein, partial [Candidatus Acidoferrum sp.]|nr:methyltransferase domain-containing protein [Candidatus Acidoferrum sp.]